MKITKRQLRRIIREAKYQILNENVENEITFKVTWYLRRVIRDAVSEYVEGPITVNADDLIKYGGKDPRGLALVWGKKENERGSYNMYQARLFERRDITMSDDEEKRVKKWMFDTYEKLGHVPEDVEAIAAERERLYWEEYAKKERQREERAKKRKLKKIMSFKAKFQNFGSQRSVVKDITISAKDLVEYGEDDDARGFAIWWAKNRMDPPMRGRYEPDEVTIDDRVRDKVENWMNDIYEALGLG